MTKILLLDVDGVLVQPAGYREALRATVNYFIDPPLVIEEDSLAELERCQITSEWDMAPLLIASYWNEVLTRQPMPGLAPDVFSAAAEINRRRVEVPRHLTVPEFPLLPGSYPAHSAYEAGCYPAIPEDLRRELLTETRNVYRSPTTRITQHFTLGSKHFQETYGLEPVLESESFLLLHDLSPIDEQIRSKLVQPGHYLVAFTNRPSGPPREFGNTIPGYPPEAELALELAGLRDIPSMSFGRFEYLAAQYGHDPAALVKPSPVHALAAVLAAWTGEEWNSLLAANHWVQTRSLNGKFIRLPKRFELVVVEDTLGGILSVRGAVEIMRNAGFNISLYPFGLTGGNPAKASAFQKAGVPHYADWPTLIDVIV